MEENALYRAAQPSTQALDDVLQKYGIRTVLNLRGENPQDLWWRMEKRVCESRGAALIDISLNAHAFPTKEALLTLYDSFFSEEYPLLIHCKAGADRTGLACALWRLCVRGEAKEQAKKELSPRFGHFSKTAPEMEAFLELFEPSREWILFSYEAVPL